MSDFDCCGCLTWFRRKISSRGRSPSLAASRLEENEVEEKSIFDNGEYEEMYSDIRRVLRGQFSIDTPAEEKKKSRFWQWLVGGGKDRRDVEKFRSYLLSKGLDGANTGQIYATFPISTSNFDYYGKMKNSTSCTSFVTIYDPGVDNVLRIYQHPIACPTAPVRRLTIDQPIDSRQFDRSTGYGAPICCQLGRNRSEIIVYWQDFFAENKLVDEFRTDRMLIYDLGRKFSATHFSIKIPSIGNYLYFVFKDNDADDRLKLIYFNLHVYGDRCYADSRYLKGVVYECDIETGDHFPTIRLIDTKTWPYQKECRLMLIFAYKSFDNECFVWFFKYYSEPNFEQGLFCLTYERNDDLSWTWSPEPIPFMEWFKTSKWGQRFGRGVLKIQEIQPTTPPLDLLKNVELKYQEGMVFAKVQGDYVRRYVFRPPSLQSLAADLVRRMIDREIEETRSLSKWNWWRQLVGAAGLFDPCPSDYGRQELTLNDVGDK